MKDVIRLIGMQLYGYHGVSSSEKETGRLFEVDCEMQTDLADAGHSDRLVDTVDYSKVYDTIKEVVTGTAYALLEKLASELAALLLDRFPVYRVTLKVRKLQPPVAGPIRYVEVEVTRYQGDTSKLTDEKGSDET